MKKTPILVSGMRLAGLWACAGCGSDTCSYWEKSKNYFIVKNREMANSDNNPKPYNDFGFFFFLWLFWVGAGALFLFKKEYFYDEFLHLDTFWEAIIFFLWEIFNLGMIFLVYIVVGSWHRSEEVTHYQFSFFIAILVTLSVNFFSETQKNLTSRNYQTLFPTAQFSVQLKIEALQQTSQTLALKLADIERSASRLQTQSEELGEELSAIKGEHDGRSFTEIGEETLILKKLKLYQQQLAYYQKLKETGGKLQRAIKDLDLRTREAQVDKEMIATIERFGSESELKQMIDGLEKIIQQYDPDQYVVDKEHLDLKSYEEIWKGL